MLIFINMNYIFRADFRCQQMGEAMFTCGTNHES